MDKLEERNHLIKGDYENKRSIVRFLKIPWPEYLRESYGISRSRAHCIYHGKKDKHIVPEKIRWQIWELDNFTCAYCGVRRFLTVDHILASSKGGSDTLENLITACRKCNSSKHTKHMPVIHAYLSVQRRLMLG